MPSAPPSSLWTLGPPLLPPDGGESLCFFGALGVSAVGLQKVWSQIQLQQVHFFFQRYEVHLSLPFFEGGGRSQTAINYLHCQSDVV